MASIFFLSPSWLSPDQMDISLPCSGTGISPTLVYRATSGGLGEEPALSPQGNTQGHATLALTQSVAQLPYPRIGLMNNSGIGQSANPILGHLIEYIPVVICWASSRAGSVVRPESKPGFDSNMVIRPVMFFLLATTIMVECPGCTCRTAN
jgi:hypothetical protein